jgi:surface antigen
MRRSTNSTRRRPSRSLVLMLTLVAGLVATAAGAQVYGFLEQGAVRYFRGDDARLMSENLDAVLATPGEDEPGEWRNPETGSHGSAVVERSFEHQGMSCRRVRLANHAGSIDDTSVADMCQVDDAWKVLRLPE